MSTFLSPIWAQKWSHPHPQSACYLKMMDVVILEELQMYYITVSDTIPKMDRIKRDLCWFTLDVVKPNAATGSRGGAWGTGGAVPTWKSVFGARSWGDYSFVSRQPGWGGKPQRERERERDWEHRAARHIGDLKLFWLVCVHVDVSIWRSWLFLMKEAYFVEKMNTFYHLIGSPLGWLWLRFNAV